jgi:hypothetical protein
MTKNMGSVDRTLRLLFVAAIGAAYLLGFLSGTASLVLGVVSAVFSLTSLVGTCPAYLPFGISTRNKA